MTASLTLRRLDQEHLAQFIARQLEHFVPDGLPINLPLIRQHLPQALERLRVCINAVRWWKAALMFPLKVPSTIAIEFPTNHNTNRPIADTICSKV
jgi:predicted component of type VI protein secretion system